MILFLLEMALLCAAMTFFRHNRQTKCGVLTLFPHMPLFRHQRQSNSLTDWYEHMTCKDFSHTCILLVANSTPMVDFDSKLNSFLVNRDNRLLLPTPESPIKTTATKKNNDLLWCKNPEIRTYRSIAIFNRWFLWELGNNLRDTQSFFNFQH